MRVAVGVRIARHQGDVGLGLRGIVEGEGQLRVDLPGGANGSFARPASNRAENEATAAAPITAMASNDAPRATALFTPDASPARSCGADDMTVVVSGAMVVVMPIPSRRSPGRIDVQ